MEANLTGAFDFETRTRLIFGPDSFRRLGGLAKELGFRTCLLVADHGLVEAGHVGRAVKLLNEAGVDVREFHDFGSNPDTAMIERGRDFAAPLNLDSIIGLGGGSSLDCAKAINFLLTNGGTMRDYQGFGKAGKTMLPMIGVPTTSGTGSEAQSYALISDATTHEKMACGDKKAAFRIAILDPCLTLSQPASVTAATGYDAISHAVETYVSTKRNRISKCFSREAWRLLEPNYERVMTAPEDIEARGSMQMGAYLAGMAIENSMLGAAHACANPLTAHYGATHGIAISVLLSHVIRWNGVVAGERYRKLHGGGTQKLAERLEELARMAGLPGKVRDFGVHENDLETLAGEAAKQWTGQFNPRPFDAAGALEVYRCAY